MISTTLLAASPFAVSWFEPSTVPSASSTLGGGNGTAGRSESPPPSWETNARERDRRHARVRAVRGQGARPVISQQVDAWASPVEINEVVVRLAVRCDHLGDTVLYEQLRRMLPFLAEPFARFGGREDAGRLQRRDFRGIGRRGRQDEQREENRCAEHGCTIMW